MANFNINKAGFAIAGLFVVVWAIALAYWKFANVENKWSTVPSAGQSPAEDPSRVSAVDVRTKAQYPFSRK